MFVCFQNIHTEIDLKTYSECKKELQEMHGDIIFSSMRPEQKINLQYKTHPVFEGFVSAYKNHRPITISPDIFWLLIAQAFSNHVSKNAEKLCSMFVNFSGKQKLEINRRDLNFYTMTLEDWETIFPEFVSQITNYTGKDITDTLKPDFTTTTPVSLAVGQLTIMSIMKHYFKYQVAIEGCGFPHITIEGSVEDWTKISSKLSNLSKYKFEWFTKQTIPVINKIIETKQGKIDDIFWKTMLKIKNKKDFYDPEVVNGWLCRFFPFDSKGHRLNGHITDDTELPSEIQKIPFSLNIIGQGTHECHFLAGFIGVSQDDETRSIKPEIGWFITPDKDESSGQKYDISESSDDSDGNDNEDDSTYNDFNALYNIKDESDDDKNGFDDLFG